MHGLHTDRVLRRREQRGAMVGKHLEDIHVASFGRPVHDSVPTIVRHVHKRVRVFRFIQKLLNLRREPHLDRRPAKACGV